MNKININDHYIKLHLLKSLKPNLKNIKTINISVDGVSLIVEPTCKLIDDCINERNYQLLGVSFKSTNSWIYGYYLRTLHNYNIFYVDWMKGKKPIMMFN